VERSCVGLLRSLAFLVADGPCRAANTWNQVQASTLLKYSQCLAMRVPCPEQQASDTAGFREKRCKTDQTTERSGSDLIARRWPKG
jgi:hypothetical protein